jgi:hypothetical protein
MIREGLGIYRQRAQIGKDFAARRGCARHLNSLYDHSDKDEKGGRARRFSQLADWISRFLIDGSS